jgi:hypothetical protein
MENFEGDGTVTSVVIYKSRLVFMGIFFTVVHGFHPHFCSVVVCALQIWRVFGFPVLRFFVRW